MDRAGLAIRRRGMTLNLQESSAAGMLKPRGDRIMPPQGTVSPTGREGPPEPAKELFMSEEVKNAPAATDLQPQPIPVDIEGMTSLYANFFRVTGTPEELVLDFGLNTQLMQAGNPESVKLSQRLVMSFYTAKRLLNALSWAVSRHESTFGVIETDFQKRMRTPPPPAGR
jgi:hypothetical protein